MWAATRRAEAARTEAESAPVTTWPGLGSFTPGSNNPGANNPGANNPGAGKPGPGGRGLRSTQARGLAALAETLLDGLLEAPGAELARIAQDAPALEEMLAGGPSVEVLLQLIYLRDPELVALELEYQGALEGYSQANLLADATTRLGPLMRSDPTSGRPTAAFDSASALGGLRSELVTRRAELVWERMRSRVVARQAEALETLGWLNYLAAERRALSEQLALVDELSGMIEARLSTGGADASRALGLEAEAQRLEGRIDESDLRRRARSAVLDGLLQRAHAGELVVPSLARTADAAPTPGEAFANAASPELAAAEVQIERARIRLELAQEVAFGSPAGGSSPSERARLGIMNAGSLAKTGGLPGTGPGTGTGLAARNALLGEHRLALRQAEAERAAVLERLRTACAVAEVDRAAAALRRRVAADVLPKEREVLETLRSAWSSGGASFDQITGAARALSSSELTLARAELDLWLAEVELLRITGVGRGQEKGNQP